MSPDDIEDMPEIPDLPFIDEGFWHRLASFAFRSYLRQGYGCCRIDIPESTEDAIVEDFLEYSLYNAAYPDDSI